jgi:hypothetical protein
LVIGDQLVVFGGYTDKFLTQIISVDPLSGQTQIVGELPTGLADTRFHILGREVIGVTGENGIKMRYPDTISASLG